MDETTEFDVPFNYFSHIEMTEGHNKKSCLLCKEFRRQRDSNPAPLSKG